MKFLSLLLIVLFTSSCAPGPFYRNRTCRDVGEDFYRTLTPCVRAWYDFGLTLDDAKKWCESSGMKGGE